MSAASDDRELDEALANTAQLRQRYRAVSRDEPPDVLDALIRTAARDQAVPRSARAPSRLTATWRVPLSIAAVVVVSVTVSVLVAERHGELPRDADRSVTVPPAAPKDEKRAEPGAAQRRLPSEGKGPVEPERAVPKEPAGGRRAAGASPSSDAFSTPPESRPFDEPFKTQQPAVEAPRQNAAPPAAKQQAAPPAVASPPAQPGRPGALRDEVRSEARTHEAPDRVPSPEGQVEALQKERAAPQTVAPAAAKLEQGHAVPEKKSASQAPVWESDPDAWLKHIDELRLAGQGAEAEASFRAFRDRYPDYRLPAGFVIPER